MKKEVQKKPFLNKFASANLLKKGQITVFIIVGILILMIFGIVMYMVSTSQTDTSKGTVSQQQEVPAKGQPIKQFVDGCIEKTAKNGLKIMGGNSGYIYLPRDIEVSGMPYDSDALIYEPNMMPYWYYINKQHRFQTWKPALFKSYDNDNSMEDQLGRYVLENLKDCTLGFDGFKDEYEIEEGSVLAEAIVTRKDIVFNVIFPLTIRNKATGEITKYSKFNVKSPVRLFEIYKAATAVVNAEANFTFIEKNTLSMLSLYSGINRNLPPMSDMNFFIRKKEIWTRTQTEEIIKNDILDFVRLTQIAESRGFNPIKIDEDTRGYDLVQGVYDSMSHSLRRSFDFNIDFLYPGSPIYLNIDNSEIIMPDSPLPSIIILDLIGFVMNDYRFGYDISYPVIMTINDPDAFYGTGYDFKIAVEANIINNVPVEAEWDFSNVTARPPKVRINSPSQLLNRTIKTQIKDTKNKTFLEGVDISYKCGSTSAYMGSTNDEGSLESYYPYCLFGGKIVYRKDGYAGSAITFNNVDEYASKAIFKPEMWPFISKNIKIKKRTLEDIDAIRNVKGTMGPVERYKFNKQKSRDIDPNEQVLLSIKRIGGVNDEPVPMPGFVNYQTYAVEQNIDYDGQLEGLIELFDLGQITIEEYEAAVATINEQKAVGTIIIEPDKEYILELIPGKYEIMANVLYNGEMTIPEKKFCVAEIAGICTKEEKLPEQKFTSWVSGGVGLNITLDENSLYEQNNITFYVFDLGVPSSWDDIEGQSENNVGDLSHRYKYLMKAVYE